MKNTKNTIIALCFMSSFSLSAAGPVLECSATETASYIKGVYFNLYLPANTPTAKEAQQAYIDMKTEAGDESCLSIFSGDFGLDEKWKDLQDAFNSIPAQFASLNGALLAAIDAAYENAKKQIMEELNKDMCDRIDPESIERVAIEIANRKIKDSFDIDMNNIKGSLESIGESKLNKAYGDDAKYIINPKQYPISVEEKAKGKAKLLSNEFWNDI